MKARGVRLIDQAPETEAFLRDVLDGLGRERKSIPCKYFYDERGSELFERICALEEYYVTRTEIAIMEEHAGEMAAALGAGALLVEFGSGTSRKTRLLLDRLEDPAGYVPIDISREALARTAAGLGAEYPGLEVLPVCADYTGPVGLPVPRRPVARRSVYYPGSTLGNFVPSEARRFLARIAALVGSKGGLLIGIDLKKDRRVLEAAYDDREGVTAEFNKNLLVRINRELGADFRIERFRHRALWNARHGRIEMHLVSLAAQTVRIGGRAIRLRAGETIHTENSYKYEIEPFRALAARGGLEVRRVWTDPGRMFSVQFFEAA